MSLNKKTETQQPLDFTEIRLLFEDSISSLREYYYALLEDLNTIQQDFIVAAANKDFKGFRAAVHKTGSFARIFRPVVLEAAIESARPLYENMEWEKLPAAQQHIDNALKEVIVIIQKEIQISQPEK